MRLAYSKSCEDDHRLSSTHDLMIREAMDDNNDVSKKIVFTSKTGCNQPMQYDNCE